MFRKCCGLKELQLTEIYKENIAVLSDGPVSRS